MHTCMLNSDELFAFYVYNNLCIEHIQCTNVKALDAYFQPNIYHEYQACDVILDARFVYARLIIDADKKSQKAKKV